MDAAGDKKHDRARSVIQGIPTEPTKSRLARRARNSGQSSPHKITLVALIAKPILPLFLRGDIR